jgi:hypothetical protein
METDELLIPAFLLPHGGARFLAGNFSNTNQIRYRSGDL